MQQTSATRRPIPPIVLLIGVALLVMAIMAIWQSLQPHFPLDLNTAGLEHLQRLPGVDEAMARKIIEGRPYKRKDELVRRKIVEPALYEQIKGQIVAKHTE